VLICASVSSVSRDFRKNCSDLSANTLEWILCKRPCAKLMCEV
jgi:hypothetical protein